MVTLVTCVGGQRSAPILSSLQYCAPGPCSCPAVGRRPAAIKYVQGVLVIILYVSVQSFTC